MGKLFMTGVFVLGLVILVGCLLMGVTVLINAVVVPTGVTAFTIKQTASFLLLLIIIKEILK